MAYRKKALQAGASAAVILTIRFEYADVGLATEFSRTK